MNTAQFNILLRGCFNNPVGIFGISTWFAIVVNLVLALFGVELLWWLPFAAGLLSPTIAALANFIPNPLCRFAWYQKIAFREIQSKA